MAHEPECPLHTLTQPERVTPTVGTVAVDTCPVPLVMGTLTQPPPRWTLARRSATVCP